MSIEDISLGDYDVALASQSPRRLELLTQIGIKALVVNIHVDEMREQTESPTDYVQRLAKEKSTVGSHALAQSPLVTIGSDTIVVIDNNVLEKPRDEQDAIQMLRSLGGKVHQVFTAVTCTKAGTQLSAMSRTDVSFRAISQTEAEQYWRTGEPQDKAGGYGIQGLGARFVSNLSGSYSGVVGLPLFETHQLLVELGVCEGLLTSNVKK